LFDVVHSSIFGQKKTEMFQPRKIMAASLL